MSWTSRFGSWGGRFSPFGRPDTERSNDYNQTAVPTDPKVTDGDFSYITSADLAAVEESGQMNSDEDSSSRHGQYPYKHKSHHLHHHQQQHKEPHQQHQYSATSVAMSDGSRDDVAASTSFEAPSPNRETDVLVLKHKRITYPVHFPAFSIAHGELRVGEIRAQAAQRLKIHVPRKVKLLSRGRNLRDDNQTARDAGLVAGSVIMCIVGDLAGRGEGIEKHHGRSSVNGAASDESYDYGDDDLENSNDETGGAMGSGSGSGVDGNGSGGGRDFSSATNGGKSKRRRGRNKKPKKTRAGDANDSPAPISAPTSHPAPLPPQQQQPSTPLGQLSSLAHTFRNTLLPQCLAFERSPPSDPAKREFEHRKLSETVLAQVLLKLDAVETEGDAEARKKRKELVKECQDVLGKLDGVMGKAS